MQLVGTRDMGQSAHASTAARATIRFDCSVIIPLYNKGPYIRRALASVVAQSVRPREIIIVDDGSRDDGPAIAAAFDAGDIQVRVISQQNIGVSAARNRGIGLAQGEWVAFLDADDAYLPWLMAEFAGLAQQFPKADLLGTNFQEVASERIDPRLALEGTEAEGAWRGYIGNFYDRWWRGSIFFTSSVAVKRERLSRMGEPFPVHEDRGEDLDLFYRLVEQTPVAWTSRVSSVYARSIADSLTAGGIESEPLPAFQRLLQRSALASFPAHERAGVRRCLATYWMTVARGAIRRGELDRAWRLLKAPITQHRPVYWIRTAGLLARAAAGKAIGSKSQVARSH